VPAGGGEPRARLFVALDLPDALVAGLEAWQALALDGSCWRPVRAESIHLTLAFLGSNPSAEIPVIADAVQAVSGSPAPTMSLKRKAVGIPRRRPRAVAFEADAPEVVALAEAVAGALERARLAEREDRPFWPHVTVARRRGRGPLPSQPLPNLLQEPVTLERLVLYRSETLPGGSRHHAEAAFTIT